MIKSEEPIDFEPLIKALQAANKVDTFSGQLSTIELSLVSAEINPKPHDFCEFLWALEMLTYFDYTARQWKPSNDQLKEFFE